MPDFFFFFNVVAGEPNLSPNAIMANILPHELSSQPLG